MNSNTPERPARCVQPACSASLSRLRPGLHPSHVTEVATSLRGGSIKLTAAVSESVDIWGQVEGGGNPIYPPRDPDRSVAKHGGVEGYKNSPARDLLHHITIGQYLAFSVRARNYFCLPNDKVSDGGPLTHESKQDANPPFAAPLG